MPAKRARDAEKVESNSKRTRKEQLQTLQDLTFCDHCFAHVSRTPALDITWRHVATLRLGIVRRLMAADGHVPTCRTLFAVERTMSEQDYVSFFKFKSSSQLLSVASGLKWLYTVKSTGRHHNWSIKARLYVDTARMSTDETRVTIPVNKRWHREDPHLWHTFSGEPVYTHVFDVEPDRIQGELLPHLRAPWALRPFQEHVFQYLWDRRDRNAQYVTHINKVPPGIVLAANRESIVLRAHKVMDETVECPETEIPVAYARFQLDLGGGKTVICCAWIAKLLQTLGRHEPVIPREGRYEKMPDLFGLTHPFDAVSEDHYRANWFPKSNARLKAIKNDLARRRVDVERACFEADALIEASGTCLGGGVLVLVPTTLLEMWREKVESIVPDPEDESKGARVFVFYGPSRLGKMKEMVNADVVIAPYSLARRAKVNHDGFGASIMNHYFEKRRYQQSTGIQVVDHVEGDELLSVSGNRRPRSDVEIVEMHGAPGVTGALVDPASPLSRVAWRAIIADEAHKTWHPELLNGLMTDRLIEMSATFGEDDMAIKRYPYGTDHLYSAAEFVATPLLKVPDPSIETVALSPSPADVQRFNRVLERLVNIKSTRCLRREYNDAFHRLVRRLWDTTAVMPWPQLPELEGPTLMSIQDRNRGYGSEDGGAAAVAQVRTNVQITDAIRGRMGDCPICMCDYTDPVLEPSCGNVFCKNCVVPWISDHRTCPLCRQRMGVSKLKNIKLHDDDDEEKKEEEVTVDDSELLSSPLDPATYSAKMEYVLKHLEGEKTILAVHAHHTARALAQRLSTALEAEVRYVSSSLSATARGAALRAFCSGECSVLVLCANSAGVGLNIVEATQIIFLEPYMMDVLVEQVIGRAVRQGQTRSVKVKHLVTRGTMDERLIAGQRGLSRSTFHSSLAFSGLEPIAT